MTNSSQAAASEQARIILIEDREDIRIPIAMFFEHKGWKVFEYSDGKSALDQLDETKPHAAIVDLGIPVMNVTLVAEHIRAISKHSKIVLAAFTGDTSMETRESALQAGFNLFFRKPISIGEIQTAILQRLVNTGAYPKAA